MSLPRGLEALSFRSYVFQNTVAAEVSYETQRIESPQNVLGPEFVSKRIREKDCRIEVELPMSIRASPGRQSGGGLIARSQAFRDYLWAVPGDSAPAIPSRRGRSFAWSD